MANFLAELGYQGIEIAPWVYFSSYQDFFKLDKILSAIHDAGLEVVGLHWLFGETSSYHITHKDQKIREKTSAYFCDLIKLCSDLQGEIMVIGSPNQRKILPGTTYQQAWNYTKAFLEQPLKVAEDLKITLCLEPLSCDQTNFINTVDEALEFIKEINQPCLAIMADVYSLGKEEKNMEDIILTTQGYLKHFHADDTNKKGPGAGETDFVSIGHALTRIDFRGYVSVEVHDLTVDPRLTASRSIKYMKKCFTLDFHL